MVKWISIWLADLHGGTSPNPVTLGCLVIFHSVVKTRPLVIDLCIYWWPIYLWSLYIDRSIQTFKFSWIAGECKKQLEQTMGLGFRGCTIVKDGGQTNDWVSRVHLFKDFVFTPFFPQILFQKRFGSCWSRKRSEMVVICTVLSKFLSSHFRWDQEVTFPSASRASLSRKWADLCAGYPLKMCGWFSVLVTLDPFLKNFFNGPQMLMISSVEGLKLPPVLLCF